jgi:nucleoside-triphosphatase THEP1
MFFKSVDTLENEKKARAKKKENILKYGIRMLDDALSGILQNDLVLIGASSGAGKTELCAQIALNVARKNKQVHFIALEAEEYEIERRILYSLIASAWYKKPKPFADLPKLTYKRWVLGEFIGHIEDCEASAEAIFRKDFQGLYTYYKRNKFDIEDLIDTVTRARALNTDLIIIDHVHYFDFHTDNENREIKEIAKMTRTLALENGKPIILIGHLRKSYRGHEEMVPGLEEFHGSSDLYKIATTVITLARGPVAATGFKTFVRIPKDRLDGGNVRFIAEITFNPETNSYEDGYLLGKAGTSSLDGFKELETKSIPEWAQRSTACGNLRFDDDAVEGIPRAEAHQRRTADVFRSLPNLAKKPI